MKVSLSELLKAFKRSTKMKRAPAGARSTKLKEGAFVPEISGIWVEMPGGSSFVNTTSGKLDEEVVFDAPLLTPIFKVLSTYIGKETEVGIEIAQDNIEFRSGTSKLKLPRKVN